MSVGASLFAGWPWPRLLLGALLVVLLFGACSTSEFVAENSTVQAPLVLRYRVQKNTRLLFSYYDTLSTEVLYHGQPVLSPSLCQPDSVLPVLERLQRLPQYPARWLLRIRCWGVTEPHQVVYLLRLTTTGPRLHRIGADNSGYYSSPFNLLADGRVVWVPRADTAGTLFDVEQLQGFTAQFPTLPSSVRAYGEPTEAYYLAPDRRTLARLFSPDTTTTVFPYDGASEPARRTAAPAPAVYLDEYNVTTGHLRRQHLPNRLVTAADPFRNTHWRQNSQGRWYLQFVP